MVYRGWLYSYSEIIQYYNEENDNEFKIVLYLNDKVKNFRNGFNKLFWKIQIRNMMKSCWKINLTIHLIKQNLIKIIIIY